MTRRQQRRQRRQEKKEAKATLKNAGVKGLAILLPYRGAMRKALQRRFPNTDWKERTKKNFPLLVLEFYQKIVWPNREKLANVDGYDPVLMDAIEATKYSWLPTPEEAAEGMAQVVEDADYNTFVSDAIEIAASIIKAIVQFFKSLSADKKAGKPLGALGDIAQDVEKTDDEIGQKVREEAGKAYIVEPLKQSFPVIALAAIAAFALMSKKAIPATK